MKRKVGRETRGRRRREEGEGGDERKEKEEKRGSRRRRREEGEGGEERKEKEEKRKNEKREMEKEKGKSGRVVTCIMNGGFSSSSAPTHTECFPSFVGCGITLVASRTREA